MLDLIGIGLGPFNLSLASLIDETNNKSKNGNSVKKVLDVKFFEQDKEFNWHKGMLLPDTTLQVPFLADLVTLVDPTSRYSFLNYLHHHKRMLKFYFLEDFKITRKEYNHYCQWVAAQLDDLQFSSTVLDVHKLEDGFSVTVQDDSGDTHVHYAKNVVIGTGTHPGLPDALQKVSTEAPNLCMHSAKFSERFNFSELETKISTLQDSEMLKILVIGSGQSAGEIYSELFGKQLDEYGKAKFQLDWITRSAGFFCMESSPLGLELASPAYLDHFYELENKLKRKILSEQNLLYKAMDTKTIQKIYYKIYERSIGNNKLYSTIIANQSIDNAEIKNERVRITTTHKQTYEEHNLYYDYVIAATGYEHQVPKCFNKIIDLVEKDEFNRPKISKCYRLIFEQDTITNDNKRTGNVFVQNQELHTHGFGAPDLGLGAYRSAHIVNELLGKPIYKTDTLEVFQDFR